MKDNTMQSHTPNIVDLAADSTSQAIHATQQVADQAFDGLHQEVRDLRDQASPRYDAAAHRASALAEHGVQSVRETTRRLRKGAEQLSDGTRQYVRDEPLKSVLIAAATGAVLMGLASLLARSGR